MTQVRVNADAQEVQLPPPITFEDGGVLTLSEQIGKGAYGSVYRATYNGPDARMKEMGELVVKVGKIEEDIQIAQYADGQVKTNSDRLRDFHQKVSTGYSPPGSSEPILVSPLVPGGSMDKFIQKAVRNNHPAFNERNLATTLAQMAASMKSAQNMVHEAGIFHFDTSMRNFLIANIEDGQNAPRFEIKITDFGNSKPIPPKGVAELDMTKQPLRYLNESTLSYEGGTIITDLYAMRIALLEMAAYAALSDLDPLHPGAKDPTGAIISFTPEIVRPAVYAVYARDEIQFDNKVLSALLNRVNTPADDSIKALRDNAQVMSFIRAFDPYLRELPAYAQEELQKPEGILEIRERDQALFQTCLNNFNNSMRSTLDGKQDALLQRPQGVMPDSNAPVSSSSTLQISRGLKVEPMDLMPREVVANNAAQPINANPHPAQTNAKEIVAIIKEIVSQHKLWEQHATMGVPSGIRKMNQTLKTLSVIGLTDESSNKLLMSLQAVANERLNKGLSDPYTRAFYNAVSTGNVNALKDIQSSLRAPQQEARSRHRPR